jgi:hypothetical protein
MGNTCENCEKPADAREVLRAEAGREEHVGGGVEEAVSRP